MNIFFSHSTADAGIIQTLVDILGRDGADMIPFYSSNPETGIAGGEGIMSRINRAITDCHLFVPIITENYVRSLYCMYELSVAAFLQEQGKLRIIPIAASTEIYNRVSTILQQFDLLYIDAMDEKAPRILCQTFDWLSEDQLPSVAEALRSLALSPVLRKSYVGMPEETYHGILEYCETYGVRQFKNTTLPSQLLKAKVSQAKEVILLSTTGASLIRMLCADALPTALSRDCRVSILVPNQHSQFCADVAQIERPDAAGENLDRLDHEFDSVVAYLKEAWQESLARRAHSGSITCYCSHSLLRQTVLLVKNRDDSVWAWVSMTMPPKRTVDGTPSLEAEGRLEKGQMVYLLWNHCTEIIALSRRRGSWFTIGDGHEGPFFPEKLHAKAYWQKKYDAARVTMSTRAELYEDILIEVAAQHPLHKRKVPGEEFRRRLDTAMEIGAKYEEQGYNVIYYVPGSRHRMGSISDLVSLSKAGCDYLRRKGIPGEQILGEDANEKYKGADGVYNSADECYVASRIFLEGEYERLICVCAPNQVFRKTLFYIEFGILPQCYSVPAETMFHSALGEIFDAIPGVLYEDHSWQDPASDSFINSRKERIPQDGVPSSEEK